MVGRFITRDPLGYESGGNTYGYVGNEPMGHVDPTGLILEEIWDDPVERGEREHDEFTAVTFPTFLNGIQGKSLDDLKNEEGTGKFLFITIPGGPYGDYRYVINPKNPSQVSDMRHFLILGDWGETAGLWVETNQLFHDRESAFDAQDFLSNYLGKQFYKYYDEDLPLDVQLAEFFFFSPKVNRK